MAGERAQHERIGLHLVVETYVIRLAGPHRAVLDPVYDDGVGRRSHLTAIDGPVFGDRGIIPIRVVEKRLTSA